MDDFRHIGELGRHLMCRISSGDFPLWSDELGGDLGSNPGADPCPEKGFKFDEFASVGEKAAEPVLCDPAAVTREGGIARGFVVIDGGRAGRTHAATGRPALPARLRLVTSEHHAFSGTR